MLQHFIDSFRFPRVSSLHFENNMAMCMCVLVYVRVRPRVYLCVLVFVYKNPTAVKNERIKYFFFQDKNS